MKLIIAIVQPNRVEAVKEELNKAEVFRMTVLDVQGYGQQGGKHEIFRGQEFDVDLRRKAMVLIGVNDDFADSTVKALTAAAKTEPDGAIGDGKIFVLDMEKCFRIRTGEEGSAAI